MAARWGTSHWLRGCMLLVCSCLVCLKPTSSASVGSTSYAVIIDAGSSGSRVRLYQWQGGDNGASLPDFRELDSQKVKPGISHFRQGSLQGMRDYLAPLVETAKSQVPVAQHASTAIYLLATAGMRLLMEPRANLIMEEVRAILADPSFSPFRFQTQQARILSGEEEGAFAWIAANYLNGFFQQPEAESVGVLELGGASTQIAFIPDGSILAGKFPLSLGGRHYPLYVQSYLYYGQNFADLWIKEYLHRQAPQESQLVNPCMLKGDNDTVNVSSQALLFVGSGEPVRCVELVNTFVYRVRPYHCYPKPCAIGPVYQPSVPSDQAFFALSAFAFPLGTLGVMDDSGSFTPAETLTAAHHYCSRDINDIIAETGRDPEFLSVECLMGLYIPILVTRGYGFTNTTRQIAAKFDINGEPAEWPLGAVIYESERESAMCTATSSGQRSVTTGFYYDTSLYSMLRSGTVIMLLIISRTLTQ